MQEQDKGRMRDSLFIFSLQPPLATRRNMFLISLEYVDLDLFILICSLEPLCQQCGSTEIFLPVPLITHASFKHLVAHMTFMGRKTFSKRGQSSRVLLRLELVTL